MHRLRPLPRHLDALAVLPVLQGCPRAELVAVDRFTTTVSFSPGDVLCREGAPGREAFLILEGEAEVRVGDHIVARLGRGSFCGEMALVERGLRTATVTAASRMDALAMSVSEFDNLLDGAPSVRRLLLRALTQRLRDADVAFGAGASAVS